MCGQVAPYQQRKAFHQRPSDFSSFFSDFYISPLPTRRRTGQSSVRHNLKWSRQPTFRTTNPPSPVTHYIQRPQSLNRPNHTSNQPPLSSRLTIPHHLTVSVSISKLRQTNVRSRLPSAMSRIPPKLGNSHKTSTHNTHPVLTALGYVPDPSTACHR